MADDKENIDTSRRDFLKKSGYVAGGVVGGGVIGSLFGVNFTGSDQKTDSKVEETPQFNQALMYFTDQNEFKILGEATERIFPEDDNGPGAKKLAVPYFIDHQLASSYGNNSQEYMQGPFKEGSPYQGYQSRLKRHEIFTQGIQQIEKESKNKFDNSFVDLEDDEKDEILSTFENNDVKMKGVKASDFFQLLIDATLAGVYADPLYGGNHNMEGWKMKEYPGNQMSYLDKIESEDFIEIAPESLNDHMNM